MGLSDNKKPCSAFLLVQKLGLNDSRRVIHSLKVGLALTLASLLVLIKEPYYWIGGNAIWAVITVVVVFETSAGATLSKGLNRGIGTILAGLLALGAAHLADLLQATGEPIFIGALVFLTGSVCTLMRAIAKVKRNFDYGVVIFMLTFCMVLVTGYRAGDEVMRATDRLITIMIGGLISLAVSSFLFPHWAGKDLHRLTASNFDKLGKALEEEADPIYKACREAVKSRSTEEALVVFASWEPPHGPFRLGYPWKQYLTVGAMLRHCAYSVLALHGCLRSEIQAPSGLRDVFARELLTASKHAAHLLYELGDSIRNMHKLKGSAKELLHNTSCAAQDIKESISKHSCALGNPETWRSLQETVQEQKRERIPRSYENDKIIAKVKLANLKRIQPEDVLLNPNTASLLPSNHVQDYKELQADLVNNKQPDKYKEGNITQSAHSSTLHSLLAENVPGTCCGERETELSSSEYSTKGSSCNHPTNKNFKRSRIEDTAGAASLISFASLLLETLVRLDHVVEAVQQLSESGNFRTCTCCPSREHVKAHSISIRGDDCKIGYSQIDKDLSKRLKLSQMIKSSRHQPETLMQAAVE